MGELHSPIPPFERRRIFETLPEHTERWVLSMDVKGWIANKYKIMLIGRPEIPKHTDTVIVLAHGELNMTPELPFADLTDLPFTDLAARKPIQAVETEERVIRALSDLVNRQSSREGMPIVYMVGTQYQTKFMQDVAYNFLKGYDRSLHLPIAQIDTPGTSQTSTRQQLDTAFQFLAKINRQAVLMYTSDYHKPRAEALAHKYIGDHMHGALDLTVLWSDWAFGTQIDEQEALKLTEREEKLCLKYQQKGFLPKNLPM